MVSLYAMTSGDKAIISEFVPESEDNTANTPMNKVRTTKKIRNDPAAIKLCTPVTAF